MPNRHRPGYDRERFWLLRRRLYLLLGDACACCGSKLDLCVDHPRGRNYESRRIGSRRRMEIYLKEYESGVPLRLLCKVCDPNQSHRGCGAPRCPADCEEAVA